MQKRKKMIEGISIYHILIVSTLMFFIGVYGFLSRKNLITMLMCIEIMLNAININFVALSAHSGDITGQIFSMFILTVASAEAAIGLAIVVIYFRNKGSIER